jgi:Cupin-like domain/4Fe-4S single cluster domain
MNTSRSGVINFSHLTLTLVYRCNYRCPSCLVGDKLSSREHLSYEDAVKIIDSAADLETIGTIAFVGGEPFLVYPLMVRIAEYIFNQYQVPLSASTNSYWAASLQNARLKLGPLAKYGMKSLLLSWDDFHASFGTIQQISNAITVCGELDIEPTIQNIYIKGATRIDSIKETLGRLCDTGRVRWVENPCTPIGLGSEIEAAKQPLGEIDDMPYGSCSAGSVVNIQANGDVKPCCGAGLMVDRLTMGNVLTDPLANIVRKASVNPLFNSLVAHKGPKHLVELLRHANRADLVPGRVTDPCDACQKILGSEEAFRVVSESLQSQQVQMLLTRVASEQFSRAVDADAAVPETSFALVPNFDAAEQVSVLQLDDARSEFFAESVSVHRRPVILRAARLSTNAAVEKWRDVEYLRKFAGDHLVEVTQGLTLDARTKKLARLSEYLSLITNSCYSREHASYVQNHDVPLALLEDVEDPLQLFREWSRTGPSGRASERRPLTKLFVGRYSYTDSHEHGGYDAFMYQVTGRKELLLHEPTKENTEALYMGSRRNWSPVRFLNPDYECYPLFKSNKPTHVVVRAGEALFIPDGWFHAVASIGDDVAITLTYFFPCAAGRDQMPPSLAPHETGTMFSVTPG